VLDSHDLFMCILIKISLAKILLTWSLTLNWFKYETVLSFHGKVESYLEELEQKLVLLLTIVYNIFIMIVLAYRNLHSILSITLSMLVFRLMKWWCMRPPILSDLVFSFFGLNTELYSFKNYSNYDFLNYSDFENLFKF
jgi:hypothetical protein